MNNSLSLQTGQIKLALKNTNSTQKKNNKNSPCFFPPSVCLSLSLSLSFSAVTSEHWIQRERNCQPSRGARPPSLPCRGARPPSRSARPPAWWLSLPNPTKCVSLPLEIQCSEVTSLFLSLSFFLSPSPNYCKSTELKSTLD